MNNKIQKLTLDYNQVYTNYPKYRYLYFDILGKNLRDNMSVAYASFNEIDNSPTLSLGIIKLKDHTISIFTDEGLTCTEITFKNVPYIRLSNGNFILNTSKNCIGI